MPRYNNSWQSHNIANVSKYIFKLCSSFYMYELQIKMSVDVSMEIPKAKFSVNFVECYHPLHFLSH
jgi:hypothetical protein